MILQWHIIELGERKTGSSQDRPYSRFVSSKSHEFRRFRETVIVLNSGKKVRRIYTEVRAEKLFALKYKSD
jgi:hypothetical protein